LGGGVKARAGTSITAGPAGRLDDDAEAAIGVLARPLGDPVGDLALEHQGERAGVHGPVSHLISSGVPTL
jgi:hypothetical protein